MSLFAIPLATGQSNNSIEQKVVLPSNPKMRETSDVWELKDYQKKYKSKETFELPRRKFLERVLKRQFISFIF